MTKRRGFDVSDDWLEESGHVGVGAPSPPTSHIEHRRPEPEPEQVPQTGTVDGREVRVAKTIAQDLEEQWRAIGGKGPLPTPVGPPPSPAGHAPLPKIVDLGTRVVPPPQPLTGHLGYLGQISRDATEARITVRNDGHEPVHVTGHFSGEMRAPSVPSAPSAPSALPSVVSGGALAAQREEEPVERPPPPVGREEILALDAVLCDPRDNHMRLGLPWLDDDPEVMRTARTIETAGLKNPIGVRLLPEPIEREVVGATLVTPAFVTREGRSVAGRKVTVTHYTHRLVDGFKRYAALRRLERLGRLDPPIARFTEWDVDDAMAVLHNGIENVDRKDPTEFEHAGYFLMLAKTRGWDAERIAAEVGSTPARVHTLVMIADRLPPKLLEVFRHSPTTEVRRDLARIAKIERETPEETHQAMIDEYAQLGARREALRAADREAEDKSEKAPPDGSSPRASPIMSRAHLDRLRLQAQGATEYFDVFAEGWRPVTEEMRAYADALLRHVSNRRLGRMLR